MKNIKTNWLAIIILCILGFSVYNNYSQHNEIKSLKSEVSEIESIKSDLFESIDSFQHELSVCKSEKDAANYYKTTTDEVEVANPYKEYYEANYTDNPDGTVSQKEK